MNSRGIKVIVLIISVLLTFVSCGDDNSPQKIVTDYLDALITGTLKPLKQPEGEFLYDTSKYLSNQYIDYKKIQGKKIRSYELVTESKNFVSMKITFSSKFGTDIIETHSFEVKDGLIIKIDGDDGSQAKKLIEETKKAQERMKQMQKELETE